VGAGPAGLTAAVWLGRSRRSVVVCDDGQPRNYASHALHGWLGADGVDPAELRARGRAEAARYGVVFVDQRVLDAHREGHGFVVTLADETRVASRTLLLATGLMDQLPEVEGLRELYGRSVFHCPYCDAWELRDQAIGVLGPGRHGLELARMMRQWSKDVVWFPNGHAREGLIAEAQADGVEVHRGRVARLEGTHGVLERVILRSGVQVPRRALFFASRRTQRSDLPFKLGCRLDRGRVVPNRLQGVSEGLYVAGDAAKDVQFAVVAAAEGARAAYAIDRALREADRTRG
jgi:thioredoxin reductase